MVYFNNTFALHNSTALKTIFTYYFLLLVASGIAQSFQGNINIENITFPEGNQLAYAYDIAQDSTGLLWLRAGPSLYTYDGHTLAKVEQHELGVSFTGIHHLHADNKHHLFYLPCDSLIIYDPVTRKVVQVQDYASDQPGLLPRPYRIAYLGIGEDHVLWGVAFSKGFEDAVVVRSKNGEAFQAVDAIDISWYYDVTLVRGDHFFVKLRDRIEAFDSSGRVQVYQFPAGPDPVMPSMVKDADNTIWALYSPDKSTDQFGVYYLKEGQSEFVRLPAGRRFPQEGKMGMLFADGAFIWHRGYPFRLSRMRIADGTFEDFTHKIIGQSFQFTFYNSVLLNLYRDRSGALWLTTRAGIVKMTIEDDLFRGYGLKDIIRDCSNENCLIRGIAEGENGALYLSSYSGITVLDPQTGRLSALPLDIPPQNQKVHALTYARGTLFWNEYAIDLKTYTSRKLFPSSSYDYLTHGLDPQGTRLWIAVNDFPFAFYYYDLQQETLTEAALPDSVLYRTNSEIRQIHYSTSTGTLFLAIFLEGLLELDINGQVLHQYDMDGPAAGRLPNNGLYGVHEDENGQLWIAHEGEAGLSKMDLKSREITEYPYELNAFTGTLKRVFRILPGKEGFLWLVTEKGTLRLNSKSRELIHFPMFPTLSEMAFHQLPALAAKDGALYIGTLDGSLQAFDPEALYHKAGFDQAYPVVITRFDRFNQKKDTLITQLTGLGDLSEIHLTHRDRYFDLQFFVPDFRKSGQILYSHWLENYDKEWSTPDRIHQLRYENLPPGEYTLHIQGGLTPEYYASSERVLKVWVYPAWYTSWWASTLFILLLSGLLYRLYRYQVGRQLERAEAHRLRELDALKSRLYTNITHEFRTPLTVIMGMAGNIKGHTEEKELIRRNSENLLRLINQILDLSKLDAGRLHIDAIQADIVPYLQYLTESFYSLAEEKRIRLTFYPEIKGLFMDFDEAKIQQIVYNLLSNAVKFTPEGGKIILHLRQLEARGQPWLQIKVSDTGVGIAEKELPHIFDRFYQVEGRNSGATYSGTGIGLALTKELVELMGGQIAVESKPGAGTDFLILLPIRRMAGKPQKAPAGTLKIEESEAGFVPRSEGLLTAPDETATDPDHATLLIIEDNRDVVTYIRSLLQADYRIEIARNGQEGIDKALELIPDIIISDVMMPEKDGYEVCETLKKDRRTSHIPIILLTARATAADRIMGLRKGADVYLMKPFNKEELYVRLEKLLELRRDLQRRYAGERFGKFSKFGKSGAAAEPTLEDLFLQQLQKTVLENLDDSTLGAEQLGRAVHLSTSQLYRKLNALTGEPPNAFIRKIRLHQAMEMLTITHLSISEIAYAVGFNDPNYFSRAFSKEFGKTPIEIRK